MVNEIARIIKFFSMVCVVVLIINQVAYCIIPYIRVVDVYIGANDPSNNPNWRIYSDDTLKLSLFTHCLEKLVPKVKKNGESLDKEESDDGDMEYRCIPAVKKEAGSTASTSSSVNESVNVTVEVVCIDGDETTNSLEIPDPESSISCPPGQPLAIKVTKIKEIGKPNFDKYRYRGILFAEEGVVEEENVVEVKNGTLESEASRSLMKKGVFLDRFSTVRSRSGSSSRPTMVLESRARSSSNANIKTNQMIPNVTTAEINSMEIGDCAPIMDNALRLSASSVTGSPNVNDFMIGHVRDSSKRMISPRRSPSPLPSRSISPGAREIIEAKKKQQDIESDELLMEGIPEEERNKKIRVDIQTDLFLKNEATMWIPLKLILNRSKQSKSGLVNKVLGLFFKKGEG